MNVTELRIGNYIQLETEYNNFILLVVSISEKKLIVRYNSGNTTLNIKEVKRIPLTEEFILKCGFQVVGFYDNVYCQDSFRIFLNKKTNQGLVKYETEKGNIEIEVKSIHQLQNLYFAITGLELPVIL